MIQTDPTNILNCTCPLIQRCRSKFVYGLGFLIAIRNSFLIRAASILHASDQDFESRTLSRVIRSNIEFNDLDDLILASRALICSLIPARLVWENVGERHSGPTFRTTGTSDDLRRKDKRRCSHLCPPQRPGAPASWTKVSPC